MRKRASLTPTCRSKRPGAVERSERLTAVAAMIYLIFNEGYSASGDTAEIRAPLCEEAIRLARLLLRLFQSEPEIMGLTALLLLQHARADARFDDEGVVILLDDQDRSRWNQKMIAEGLALIDKAMRHRNSGPYQVQAAIAALHARAEKPEDTDWKQIDLLYGALEIMQPSPVVTLNRAVAVSKVRGPEAALEMIEPLGAAAVELFSFLRRARRVPDAAWPQRRGPRGVRPRHRARQYFGGSRPHPDASRPSDARQPAARHQNFKKIIRAPVGSRVARSSIGQSIPMEQAMSTIAQEALVSKPALWMGRLLSGLVIIFLLFDGAIKLVPWPIVTETMDRIGYGSSETLARSLGIITIVCTVLYSVPPTSILGAILLTGYLGGAMASHLRIGSPLFTHILFGFYLGLMLWGGLWLRDRNLRTLLPFRR